MQRYFNKQKKKKIRLWFVLQVVAFFSNLFLNFRQNVFFFYPKKEKKPDLYA